MMFKFIRKMIEVTLANPILFEAQQKFCNDYKDVREEFSDFLSETRAICDFLSRPKVLIPVFVRAKVAFWRINTF